MSLKIVHVTFITFATLLAMGFGAWELNNYRIWGNGGNLAGAIIAIVIGIGLIVYGFWFLKKAKRLIL